MAAKLKKLPWEAELAKLGMPKDEIEYRRYREEMILTACADAQNALERSATRAALMLNGLSVAEVDEEMGDRSEAKLGEIIEAFRVELRHCVRLMNNPKATDTWKIEEVAV
jgi:hypothetical protein